MKMNGITADLVGSEPGQVAVAVEIGVVEDTHPCATHVADFDITHVDRRTRYKDDVSARPFGILGSDHDVARNITGVRQKLDTAGPVSRTFMRVLQRCR